MQLQSFSVSILWAFVDYFVSILLGFDFLTIEESWMKMFKEL